MFNFLKDRVFHFVIYAAIGLAMWGISYKLFFQKVNDTKQDAHEIVNNYNQPKSTFGCATTRVMMLLTNKEE